MSIRAKNDRRQSRWRIGLIVIVAVTVMAVAVTASRLAVRQDTLFRWNGVTAVTGWMTSTGGWAIDDMQPPCRDANPEAYVELARPSGVGSVDMLVAYLERQAWIVKRDSPAADGFVGQSADARVRMAISREVDTMTAEITLDERC